MSLNITKTIKLYIDGKFVRTESGRSAPVLTHSGKEFARVCKASRKDFRNCIESSIAGHQKWNSLSAYNRGQILYRMAEMFEGKREDFVKTLMMCTELTQKNADQWVSESITAIIYYAGFCDKFMQLAGSINPVNGSYRNLSWPESLGVTCIVDRHQGHLPTLITALCSMLAGGNSVVIHFGKSYPSLIAPLSEVIATSDVPSGTINLLTGDIDELINHIGSHRNVKAICWLNENMSQLHTIKELGTDNLKHIHSTVPGLNLESICRYVNYKSLWQPSGF